MQTAERQSVATTNWLTTEEIRARIAEMFADVASKPARDECQRVSDDAPCGE